MVYIFLSTLQDLYKTIFYKTVFYINFHCNEMFVLFTASLEADGRRVRFTGSAEGNSLAVLFTLKMMLVGSDFIFQPLLRALPVPRFLDCLACPRPSGPPPPTTTNELQYKTSGVKFLPA